jgi:hypothetical protein
MQNFGLLLTHAYIWKTKYKIISFFGNNLYQIRYDNCVASRGVENDQPVEMIA